MKSNNNVFILNLIKAGYINTGVVEASIGKLIKAHLKSEEKCTLLKISNILNLNTGKLSAEFVKEIYVLDDGYETTADVGLFEHYSGIKLKKENIFTAGQILYTCVLEEQRIHYDGKPIYTADEYTKTFNELFKRATKGINKAIISIDIDVVDGENSAFLNAINQIIQKGDIKLLVKEFYSDPIGKELKILGSSLKKLKGFGIKPEFISFLTQKDSSVEQKIREFCKKEKFSDKKYEISEKCSFVYETLKNFENGIIYDYIKNNLELNSEDDTKCTLDWLFKKYGSNVSIGIITRYKDTKNVYFSLVNNLYFACKKEGVNLELVELNPSKFKEYKENGVLEKLNGIVCPGGFGSTEYDLKCNVIKFARENNIPFLGICLGLQLFFIEYARNVLGINNATSTEFDSSNPAVVVKIKNALCKNTGSGCYLGQYDVSFEQMDIPFSLSKLNKTYKFRHSYGLCNKIVEQCKSKDLLVGGIVSDGRFALLANKNHPFMLGVQFHPELTSTIYSIDPIFLEFIKAAIKK
ncbi:pyrG [Ecytonucleospora hepatopenaei]|uniref:CTP synthase n=1 Tax=Ecytonucleospora hepatopenaei TaxID=646526 RepID=A0A1W0E736_9MICR|nr:pyrG [Ecytonucleospora hepatopenaei]